MAGGSSKDLVYNIVSTSTGDGFKKTAQDADDAADGLDKVGRKGDEIGQKKPKIDIDANPVEDADEKLRRLGETTGDTGNHLALIAPGFDVLHSKMALIIAAASTLAPAMLAIPAALVGVGTAVGALGAAFGGIGAALHDYSQASAAAGQSGAALAEQAFSDALAIRNGRQAIVDAERQANEQAASSADSLTSAQERLASAEQGAQSAEQALTRARQDATRALESANEAAAKGALDVRAAQFALDDAKRQQIATNESISSSSEDRAKAELAVEQAQQNLIDTQNSANNAAADAQTANQKGVEGAQNVVDAKQAQGNAIQSVADAERALAAAQRQAAQQQIQSTQAVQRAIQSLADTEEQQRLAAAAAAASGSSAATQFQRDMQKLSPIAQTVAEKMIAMKGGLDQLKLTAQNTVLPGVLPVLQALSNLAPTINTGLGMVGTAIGGVLTQLGTLMQNPAFKGQLGLAFTEGAKLVAAFGQGIVGFLPALMNTFQQAAPLIDAFTSGFKQLMTSGLPAFLNGLATGAGGTAQAITAIVTVVNNLAGPLGALIGQLAAALGPILVQLVPLVDNLVQELAGALGPIIADLVPIVGNLVVTLAQALGPILANLTPLIDLLLGVLMKMSPVILPIIQLFAQLLNTVLRALIPVLTPLIPVVLQFQQILAELLTQVLTPLIPLLTVLATTFGQLLPQLIPLIGLVTGLVQAAIPLIGVLVQLVSTILQFVIPIIGTLIGWWARLEYYLNGPVVWAVEGILGAFTYVGKAVVTSVETTIGIIKGLWDKLMDTIGGLGSRMAKAGHGMWSWFGAELKGVINSVIIDSMNWVIDQINSLTSSLSDAWSWAGVPSIGTIDHIPHLAGGGTVLREGLALVGEAGPELVRLGAGAQVTPNRETRALLGGSSTPDTFYAEMTVRYPDGQVLDRQLVEFQRRGGVSQAIDTGARRALAGR